MFQNHDNDSITSRLLVIRISSTFSYIMVCIQHNLMTYTSHFINKCLFIFIVVWIIAKLNIEYLPEVSQNAFLFEISVYRYYKIVVDCLIFLERPLSIIWKDNKMKCHLRVHIIWECIEFQVLLKWQKEWSSFFE